MLLTWSTLALYPSSIDHLHISTASFVGQFSEEWELSVLSLHSSSVEVLHLVDCLHFAHLLGGGGRLLAEMDVCSDRLARGVLLRKTLERSSRHRIPQVGWRHAEPEAFLESTSDSSSGDLLAMLSRFTVSASLCAMLSSSSCALVPPGATRLKMLLKVWHAA